MLNAQNDLKLSDFSRVRYFSESEALKLAELIQKRNVFSRHSYENNFYYQRAKDLANKTIIEICQQGNPNDIEDETKGAADLLEKLAVLSTTLVLRKKKLLRSLGIGSRSKTEMQLILGPQFYNLSSKKHPVNTGDGINIDQTFCNRFTKIGFSGLYDYCLKANDINKRVSTSLDWLFESRKEPRLDAAVVKTSIALESLLIFSESESLARSLSERTAFILSDIPDTRQKISRIIKEFYDVRSGIVHGGKKKQGKLNDSLLESVDRLTMLLYLTISANSDVWPSKEELRKWCEMERWSCPSIKITPYPQKYLVSAIKLTDQEK